MSSDETSVLVGKERRAALVRLCKEQTGEVRDVCKKLTAASAEVGRLEAKIAGLTKETKAEAPALKAALSEQKKIVKQMNEEIASSLGDLPHLIKASGKRAGPIGGSHFKDVEGFQEVEKLESGASDRVVTFDLPIIIKPSLATFFAKAKLGKASDGRTELTAALKKLLDAKVGSFNLLRDLFTIYSNVNGLRIVEHGKAKEHKAFMRISPEMRKAFGETNPILAGKDVIMYGDISSLIKSERVTEPDAAQQTVLQNSAALVSAARAETHAIASALKAAEEAREAKLKEEKQAAKAAEKAEKDAKKAAEKAEKDAAKAAKAAEKAAAKAAKEASAEPKQPKARKTAPAAAAGASSSSKAKKTAETPAPAKKPGRKSAPPVAVAAPVAETKAKKAAAPAAAPAKGKTVVKKN